MSDEEINRRIEELENLLWQTRSFVGECAECSASGASMCAATELYPKIEAALKDGIIATSFKSHLAKGVKEG